MLTRTTFSATLAMGVLLFAGAAAAQSVPVITSVTITGSPGQSFGLTITGSGFGSGKKNVSYPYVGDSEYFHFIDMHPVAAGSGAPRIAHINWSAGYGSKRLSDPVTLDYMVWTDTEIQFCGFYGQYGQNGFVMTSGDTFEIKISAPTGTAKAIYIGKVP